MKRVKNKIPFVWVTSAGSNRTLVMKSRVWSRAMMTMTNPRNTSTEASRGACAVRNDVLVSVDTTAGELDAITIVNLSSLDCSSLARERSCSERLFVYNIRHFLNVAAVISLENIHQTLNAASRHSFVRIGGEPGNPRRAGKMRKASSFATCVR